MTVPYVPVLQAQQLNIPGLRVHLDSWPQGVSECQRGMIKLWVTLRPQKCKKWKEWIPSLLCSDCTCSLLHYKYHSKDVLTNQSLLERLRRRRCRKAGDVSGSCSVSSPVLLCPWRAGLQAGNCWCLVGGLLRNCYSSECSVCIWTLHLIRLFPAKHGRLGEEKAACSIFLRKWRTSHQTKLFGFSSCKQKRDLWKEFWGVRSCCKQFPWNTLEEMISFHSLMIF